MLIKWLWLNTDYSERKKILHCKMSNTWRKGASVDIGLKMAKLEWSHLFPWNEQSIKNLFESLRQNLWNIKRDQDEIYSIPLSLNTQFLVYIWINKIFLVSNMNAFFSFDLFMVYIPECKQQLRTMK